MKLTAAAGVSVAQERKMTPLINEFISKISKLHNESVHYEVSYWKYAFKPGIEVKYRIYISGVEVGIIKDSEEELEAVLPLLEEEVKLKMKAKNIHKQAECKLIGKSK